MATLKIYRRPEGFHVPGRYRFHRNAEGIHNYSYANIVESEAPQFQRFAIGRFFEKEITIIRPGPQGLEEVPFNAPVRLLCQVYVPRHGDEIYVVGGDYEKLQNEFLMFFNAGTMPDRLLDLGVIEDASFRTGTIELYGHQYLGRNRTVRYNVQKVDGAPFRQQDPDFVPHRQTPKEVLKITLYFEDETDTTVYVHADGKITRQGQDSTARTPFQELMAAYQILRNLR